MHVGKGHQNGGNGGSGGDAITAMWAEVMLREAKCSRPRPNPQDWSQNFGADVCGEQLFSVTIQLCIPVPIDLTSISGPQPRFFYLSQSCGRSYNMKGTFMCNAC